LESAPETTLDAPHPAIVGFVVISHQMQQPMQNKSPKIPFKSKRSGIASLIICGLGRDKNITQVRRISCKGQDIRWFVVSPICAVIRLHRAIGYENNRERLPFQGQFRR
jgi:hypothetical protein